MYIRKELRNEIEILNNYVDNFKNTKGFKDFINSKKIYIAVKDKDKFICSKCNNHFSSNKKINEYDICPKCKQKLLLKRTKRYEYKDYVMYLIKYFDKYIVRNYEINSYYCGWGMKHIVTEYGRQEIDKDGRLGLKIMINNMRKNIGGYWYINYIEKTEYWKPEYYLSIYGFVYIDDNTLSANYWNPKELLDNAEVNISDILYGIYYNNYTLEMLVKNKLYNLASEFQEFKKGKFEDAFGVDKSYLPFMIENNITYRELETLKMIKIKNYDVIKYFSNLYQLEKLLEYCKPLDLYLYKLNVKNVYEYLDYLKFAKELGFDITNKKYLYPKNLKQKHDEYMNQIKINKNKTINKKIKSKYKKLIKNKFEHKNYIIIPANSIESLIDESSQQNNCVKTYAERIAKNECDIYFMRFIDSQDKSLVTIEVRNNKVVQQRTKNNMDTNKEQKKVIKLWENKMLNCS